MRIFRLLGILAWAAVAGAAAPIYTVTDLGTLGGSTTAAVALSANGLAAGWGVDPLGNTEALIFGGAGPTNLWSNGQATGINSLGRISGTAWTNGAVHGVVWSGSGTVDLGANTSAIAINDAGQVAGSGTHAFYQNGATTDLGTLAGGNWSLAEGLSGNGNVAGYGDAASGIRGLVWSPGAGLQQLDTLGGNNSYGMSVNDAGEVAGSAAIASGYLHAASWLNGTVADLGTLGGNNSYAYGINDLGVMVGYSWLSGNNATDAFIVLDGVMVDLNSLLSPPESGWVITAAYGVNNRNQIVGEATYNGQSHAVLLNDPPSAPSGGGPPGSAAPEPATWTLAGIAVAIGIAFRRGFNRPR